MAHVRAQIRDALATALTGTVPAVKKSRAYGWKQTDGDALFIYNADDQVFGRSSSEIVSDLTTSLEVLVFGRVDVVDDELDAYAVAIQNVLQGSTLSGLVKHIFLSRTEIDFDDTGEVPFGVMRLTYAIRYGYAKNDPETAT